MSDAIAKYRILGRASERQRVDGQDRNVGDIVEMTAEAAEFYLREGRIEPFDDKPAKPAKPVASEA